MSASEHQAGPLGRLYGELGHGWVSSAECRCVLVVVYKKR